MLWKLTNCHCAWFNQTCWRKSKKKKHSCPHEHSHTQFCSGPRYETRSPHRTDAPGSLNESPHIGTCAMVHPPPLQTQANGLQMTAPNHLNNIIPALQKVWHVCCLKECLDVSHSKLRQPLEQPALPAAAEAPSCLLQPHSTEPLRADMLDNCILPLSEKSPQKWHMR